MNKFLTRFRILLSLQNKKDGGLPSAYQRVSYIESSGTQYINTGYKPNVNTKWELTVQFTQLPPAAANSGYINGYSIGQNTRMAIGLNNDTNIAADISQFYFGVADKNLFIGHSDLNKHTFFIDMMSKTYGYDNVIATHNYPSYSSNANLYLFNRATRTIVGCYQKLYNSKIYENNTLVRDFIPCYRKADNVAGLYDRVNDVFYTNAGTGEFIAGEDI